MIGDVAVVARGHQRRDAVVVGPVDVVAQLDEQLDDLQPLLGRLAAVVAVDERQARRRRQHRLAVPGDDLRIGAALEQQLHQLEIGGERGAHQRGGKDDARRAFAHPRARRVVDERVGVGAGIEQLADERHRIGRHHPREVRRRFHVAPIDGPEERREPLRVGLVDVGLVVHEERRHLVVAVEDRQRQRRLAVAGRAR